MSAEDRKTTFRREMETGRHRDVRLDPLEIVRLAMKSGLTAPEALEALGEIQERPAYRNTRSREVAEGLTNFIASACMRGKSQNIAEFISEFSLPNTQILEHCEDERITYVCTNRQVQELLQEVFKDKGPTTFESVAAIPNGRQFDAIICHPFNFTIAYTFWEWKRRRLRRRGCTPVRTISNKKWDALLGHGARGSFFP